MKIKVLIADDNPLIREGMKIILNSFPDFDVVGAVEDGRQAVTFCLDHEVDVALLDIRMPDMNGVEATKLIVEQTQAKPLILTTFDDDEFVLDAIRCGARGYLLKNNDPEQICDAIKSVHHNHHVLQATVLDKIKSNLVQEKHGEESGQNTGSPFSRSTLSEKKVDLSFFTDREVEVMAQVAKGLSNKQIAGKLFISEGTIANHITSILNKTGLDHRTQIAIYYLTGKVTLSDE